MGITTGNYGYGYGDGSGDGSGDGLKVLAANAIQNLGLSNALGFIAFWKSDKRGLPSNGGKSQTPAAPGLVEEIPGPLRLCTKNALHATLDPNKWKGERLWLVELHGEIAQESDKVGALKRTILCEIPLP